MTEVDQQEDTSRVPGCWVANVILLHSCSLALQIAANKQAASKRSRGVTVGHPSGLTMNWVTGSGQELRVVVNLSTLFFALICI